MNVKQIIKEHIEGLDLDGLVSEDGDCCCSIDQLFMFCACKEWKTCEAGHKAIIDDDFEGHYKIIPDD